MIRDVSIRLNQFFEMWKASGITHALHSIFFINRGIIIVEKDLSSLGPFKSSLAETGIQVVEITREILSNKGIRHCLKSRQKKIGKYLEQGYKGWGLIKGDRMIGDIWCFISDPLRPKEIHSDLKWLKIELLPKEAYLFDMFIKPEERGKGTANFIFGNTLHSLKERGFSKIYGYYFADNLPALWVHRILRYKEIDRIRVRRIFPNPQQSILKRL